MQRQFRHAAHPSAVIHPPRIFPPRAFLSVPEQVRATNMVVMAHFRTTQPAEI